MKIQSRLSPDVHPDYIKLLHLWNGLRLGGDSGATTWKVLDPIEKQVEQCLNCNPPDIGKANSLTAQAMFLFSGINL